MRETVIGDGGDVYDFFVYRGLLIDLDCVSGVFDAPGGVCAREIDQPLRFHCCNLHGAAVFCSGTGRHSLVSAKGGSFCVHAPSELPRRRFAPPAAFSLAAVDHHWLESQTLSSRYLAIYAAVLVLPLLPWLSTRHCGCQFP